MSGSDTNANHKTQGTLSGSSDKFSILSKTAVQRIKGDSIGCQTEKK